MPITDRRTMLAVMAGIPFMIKQAQAGAILPAAHEEPEQAPAEATHLPRQASQSQDCEVHLGPQAFLRGQEILDKGSDVVANRRWPTWGVSLSAAGPVLYATIEGRKVPLYGLQRLQLTQINPWLRDKVLDEMMAAMGRPYTGPEFCLRLTGQAVAHPMVPQEGRGHEAMRLVGPIPEGLVMTHLSPDLTILPVEFTLPVNFCVDWAEDVPQLLFGGPGGVDLCWERPDHVIREIVWDIARPDGPGVMLWPKTDPPERPWKLVKGPVDPADVCSTGPVEEQNLSPKPLA